MTHFHPLSIKKIERITPNAVTIAFTVPTSLKEVFNYKPGQYITIKKILNGTELRRSYSICSTPNSSELVVSVKKMRDGSFSRFANNELKEGDVLEVHPPEGRFVFEPNDANIVNLAAFAAGSGITPVMGIMKSFLEQKKGQFALVYGNQSVTETMFYNEINELKKAYSERLHVYFTFSRTQEGDSLFGRIEKSTANFVLKNKLKDISFDAYYLCGPQGMIETVTETLVANQIPKEKIKTELFTSSTPEAKPQQPHEGKTVIKVVVDDETFEFGMDKKQRVLDAVLSQKIDAPYSCQGGICSSCLARVKEGSVEMVKNQILTDAEVAEGLVLTCQSLPLSDTLFIDYDDV